MRLYWSFHGAMSTVPSCRTDNKPKEATEYTIALFHLRDLSFPLPESPLVLLQPPKPLRIFRYSKGIRIPKNNFDFKVCNHHSSQFLSHSDSHTVVSDEFPISINHVARNQSVTAFIRIPGLQFSHTSALHRCPLSFDRS